MTGTDPPLDPGPDPPASPDTTVAAGASLRIGGGTAAATGISGWTQTFYAFNWRGDTVNRLNSSSNLLSTSTYTAYGAQSTAQSNTDPFDGFGGQWGYHKETEGPLLYLAGYRYYSPDQGRWLTRDPIGYAGGINLYSYAGNNPVNTVDPWGLWGSDIDPFDDSPAADKLYTTDLTTLDKTGVLCSERLLSFEISFIPGLNAVQGAHQAIGGIDPLSGDKLNAWERGFGGLQAAVPVLGGLGIVTDIVEGETGAATRISSITRGTVDVDHLVHYVWTSPGGNMFDLHLASEIREGALVVTEAHIQPVGKFDPKLARQSAGSLQYLAQDLGQYFGVNKIHVLEQQKLSKRSFGPVIAQLVDGAWKFTRPPQQ